MDKNKELITLLETQDKKSEALTFNLAELYIKDERFSEAEELLKTLLPSFPDNEKVKHLLAEAYFYQSKTSVAMVITEELLKQDSPAPETLLFASKLIAKTDSAESASKYYFQAVEQKPSLADRALDHFFAEYDYSHNLPFSADNSEMEKIAVDAEAPDALMSTLESLSKKEPQNEFLLEKSDISFKDVGGMREVKEEVGLKIIHPLTHPDLYQAYGKNVGGGILMYGPPGCGKTYLARATAGEVNASFLSIGINDVLDMYLGQSEKKLHSLFEMARDNRPTVLFFDEVDALGAKRSDMRQSAGRHLINQFLSELDGVKTNNEGILVLAATNTPWHLDSAFRRPGRFDRIIFIPPPDLEARSAILDLLLAEKPMTEKVDTMAVAKKTKEYSGADLKSLVDITVEDKLRDAMKLSAPQPITTKDLIKATKRVRPSVTEWFETAKNYALYSNQTGLYDDILDYLKIKR